MSLTRQFKNISPTAVLELRTLDKELQTLMSRPSLTRSDSKRADVIIARMAAIRDAVITDLDYDRAQAEALDLEINGSAIQCPRSTRTDFPHVPARQSAERDCFSHC